MSGTTVQAARQALRDLWAARLPAGTHLSLGPRWAVHDGRLAGADEGPSHRVRIAGVRWQSNPETLGPSRRMLEVYDIRVQFSVTAQASSDDDDQEAVTNALIALYHTAELAVRDHQSQTLGVPGVRYALIAGEGSLEESPASATGGPVNSVIEALVHVEASYQLD